MCEAAPERMITLLSGGSDVAKVLSIAAESLGQTCRRGSAASGLEQIPSSESSLTRRAAERLSY